MSKMDAQPPNPAQDMEASSRVLMDDGTGVPEWIAMTVNDINDVSQILRDRQHARVMEHFEGRFKIDHPCRAQNVTLDNLRERLLADPAIVWDLNAVLSMGAWPELTSVREHGLTFDDMRPEADGKRQVEVLNAIPQQTWNSLRELLYGTYPKAPKRAFERDPGASRINYYELLILKGAFGRRICSIVWKDYENMRKLLKRSNPQSVLDVTSNVWIETDPSALESSNFACHHNYYCGSIFGGSSHFADNGADKRLACARFRVTNIPERPSS